ncbi:hypothetical protein [Enterobacter sp. R4-368]|uniref:hypothetical protein n=1 Tax=Enterobacter sp. R4-368 TaxID=1166130 RepID=UPI00090397A2|nr:hypothetical protein [Enterobacter sp. R4-368]
MLAGSSLVSTCHKPGESGGSLLRALSVPVNVLYPHQRFLSRAVRAFADWITDIIWYCRYFERPSWDGRRMKA